VQTVHSAAYADPGVLAYGDAIRYGAPTQTGVTSPVVGMAATRTGAGYWLVEANGTVLTYGDAQNYGSAAGYRLNAPIVGMTVTPTGKGYWLFALDGGIFTFGDARYHGSTGGIRLNQPVVGMASTATGKGYWLVASDGGIFAFGDAHFYGSTGGIHLFSPVVGMAATPTGNGYWLAAGDGGIFSFGRAPFYGSLGHVTIAGWVNGIAATKTGRGYWLANANGDVYHFGDAAFHGDNLNTPRAEPIQAITATQDSGGYWLLEPDAFPTSFTQPGGGWRRIVGVATSQVRADPDPGSFCNPYGPCEAWCALFATWVWRASGIGIPSLAFVGNAFDWVALYRRVIPGTARPIPGELIFYGTGPQNVDTAPHMGVVTQVWPDGAVTTVEGDAGPGPEGGFNVIINGPFLPSDSSMYNGFPVFAYGVP
jgi:CHAP domain